MAMGRIARERAILRAEDTGLPITIVSERLAFPRGVQSPPTERSPSTRPGTRVCMCARHAGARGTILAVYNAAGSIAVSIFRLLRRNFESVDRKMYHPLVCVLLPLPVELNFIGLLSIRRRTESTSGPGNHGTRCPHGSRPPIRVCLCAPWIARGPKRRKTKPSCR